MSKFYENICVKNIGAVENEKIMERMKSEIRTRRKG